MFHWTNEVRNSKKSTIPNRDAPGEILIPLQGAFQVGRPTTERRKKRESAKNSEMDSLLIFYTTNIMTTNLTGVIIRYIREISGADKSSRKGKERDMTTMNRNYYLYSESYESSLQSKSEWMFNFMRSFKDRQMRDNVVLAKSRIV